MTNVKTVTSGTNVTEIMLWPTGIAGCALKRKSLLGMAVSGERIDYMNFDLMMIFACGFLFVIYLCLYIYTIRLRQRYWQEVYDAGRVRFTPRSEFRRYRDKALGGSGEIMDVYCDDSGKKPIIVFKLKHVIMSDDSQGPEEGNMILVFADQIIW